MNYKLDDIKRAWESLGWSGSPFDSNNRGFTPATPPLDWRRRLVSDESLILAFESGSGQSVALCNWLKSYFDSKRRNGEEDSRLVVVIEISEPSLDLPNLARIIAESLVGFLNGNFSLFSASPLQNQEAIAKVIIACCPDDANLEEVLHKHGVLGPPEISTFVEKIKSAAGEVKPIDSQSDDEIHINLKNALPYGYSGFTLTVDVRREQISSDARLPPQAVHLLQRMSRLATDAHVAVKLGVPYETQLPSAPSVGLSTTVMCRWTPDDLKNLLSWRLRVVQRTAKASSKPLEWIKGNDCEHNLEGFLVRNAEGKPKRLMDLGSRLLEVYGGKIGRGHVEPKIDQADLDGLLEKDFCGTMMDELPIYYKNKDEVRELCFYMGRNYDDLPGETRIDKLRELLRSLKDPLELDKLLQRCKDKYPRGRWPSLPSDLRGCP